MLEEIFSCFIYKEYNVAQTLKYITTEKHYVVSSNAVSKIFRKLRIIITKYLKVVYETDIETLWAHLKAKIKSTYNVMPAKNLYKFIKESEFKYKIRKLDDEHKIKELFDCYSFLKSIGFTDKDFND